MNKLSEFPAKVCLTVAGCLIHNDKVLLIKHGKLKIWLNPGGHIEENELPHKAAEREFWEETGVKVVAVDFTKIVDPTDATEYVPNPFVTNLHWVSKDNYEARIKGVERSAEAKKSWGRGCEQHHNAVYLLRPAEELVEFTENTEETDGIGWFSLEELDELETSASIRLEVQKAFELHRQS